MDDLSEIFKKENLSWEKFAKLVPEKPHRTTLRRNVLHLMRKLNNYLEFIGYEIIVVKKEVSDK